MEQPRQFHHSSEDDTDSCAESFLLRPGLQLPSKSWDGSVATSNADHLLQVLADQVQPFQEGKLMFDFRNLS